MRGWPTALALSLAGAVAFHHPGSAVREAAACAAAPPEGATVRIADEEALIAWDEASGVEHFVRRATFTSTAASFGFLVPTPTRPELGEVADDVFKKLQQAITPERVERAGPLSVRVGSLFMGGDKSSAAPESPTASAALVRVLEEKRVAGFDATVLEADDPAALSSWLAERGFAQSPALKEWLARYVEQRWKITAFKLAQPADPERPEAARELGTKAVRLSFKTDRPFYPYREPADQREPTAAPPGSPHKSARRLRVYFVGAARMSGALGESGSWNVTTPFAAPYSASASELGVPSLPGDAWLTVFEDAQYPRPGSDEVFFARAADQAPIKPAPYVVVRDRVIFVPIELLGLGVVGLAATGMWLWGRKRGAPRTRGDA